MSARQKAGMGNGRKRKIRTGLDYSSSATPREVYLLYKDEAWVSTDTTIARGNI